MPRFSTRCAVRCANQIRQVLGSTVIDPALLTFAERIQYDGYLRRQEGHQTIKRLAETGTSIKEIAHRTGRSRNLVRTVLRGEDGDVFRCRESMLRPFLGKLGAEWKAGCRNGAELWRLLRATDFKGGLRVATEWATKRRGSERSGRAVSHTVPPARLLSRLMTQRRDHLSKADAITIAAIETGVPMLATARDLLERFQGIVRARDTDAFAPWLTDTEGSLIASFGKGINGDLAAVRAALTDRAAAEWPDRRSDHKTQVGEAANVWPHETRSVARPTYRARVILVEDLHRE